MKKLTFLFALLCASVMGWAVGQDTWIGSTDATYNNQFKWSQVAGVATPNEVVNIQKPGFAAEIGIYVTFPDAAFNTVLYNGDQKTNGTEFKIDGAGIVFYLSSLTAQNTEIIIKNGETVRFGLNVYNDKGDAVDPSKTASALSLNSTAETLDANISQTFTIIPSTAIGYDGAITYESSNAGVATVSSAGLVTAIGRGAATITVRASETENFTASSATFTATVTGALNWDAISWIGASGDKYKIDPAAGMSVVNVQKPGWAAEDGIYCTFPAGISACSLPSGSCAIDGAGIVLYLSAFAARETEVTVTAGGVDYTFTVFYADGREVVEVYDVNLALASNGSSATASSGNAALAIDGNDGSRWESAQTDDETWTLDMGQKRIFNTIKIFWEGAFCNEFELTWSNDGENWTNFYTETNLTQAGWQTIELVDNVTARYIKYHGTKRATEWGQSFYEFQVLLPNASVLTSINLTAAAALKKIGQGVALTAQAKDQNNSNMATEFSWEITPAGAGHVTDGVYYPDLAGNATIRAYNGEVYSNSVSVYAVSSDNLALNNVIEQSTGNNGAERAVDGNEGTEWQGSATNGTADDEESRTYTCWFVVDLGIAYDIEAVTIHFEGACAQDYHVDFSANNVDWVVGYNHVGTAGVNGRTDILSTQLANTTNVRYVKFESTKAATQWGMKIFEFQVFGTESASLTKTVSASVNDAAMGTATVKQNDVAVTEVKTGSTVTFSAVANDGYVFVNWSNGNTNASFNATVDAAMNLTANFRALGTIYCNTEVENGGHTAYVTVKRSGTNEYKLVVRSTEKMTNFGGTVFYKPENVVVKDVRNEGVLSDDNHTLSVTMESDKDIYFGTPLYVVFAGVGEVTYALFNGVHPEFAIPCDDESVEVESIALDATEATIEVGATKTLVLSYTPSYAIDKTTAWTTSNSEVATVAGGVIRGIAEGTATITATCNGKTATCDVTVVPATSKAIYGAEVFEGADGLVGINYSITRALDGKLNIAISWSDDIPGLADVSVVIDGTWNTMTKDGRSATWTSESTYEIGESISEFFFYLPYAGNAKRIDVAYTPGSDNEAEKPNVIVTLNDEATDNATRILTHAGEVVDVIFTRTFPQPDEWYTLCLPFDMDEAQLTAALGEGYTLATMTGSEDRGAILHLNFDYVSTLKAGKPYMFKPGAGVTQRPTFEGVAIQNVTPDEVGDGNMTFQGTFTQTTLSSQNQRFVGPENYLYSPAEGGTVMDAFRCFFTIPAGSPLAQAPGKPARIIFGPQVATGIGDVQGDDVQCTKVLRNGHLYIMYNGVMYNVQGQKVK